MPACLHTAVKLPGKRVCLLPMFLSPHYNLPLLPRLVRSLSVGLGRSRSRARALSPSPLSRILLVYVTTKLGIYPLGSIHDKNLYALCGDLNENGPDRPFEYLVPEYWNSLGRIRRCGLVGEGMSLRVGFEVLKL